MVAPPPRTAVVDYGAGNLRSVVKALARSGFDPVVTGDPEAVRRADAVVLPGVGAFADAIAALRGRGLDAAVLESIRAGRPYLGLCLGLQVLYQESDEHAKSLGLGHVPARDPCQGGQLGNGPVPVGAEFGQAPPEGVKESCVRAAHGKYIATP